MNTRNISIILLYYSCESLSNINELFNFILRKNFKECIDFSVLDSYFVDKCVISSNHMNFGNFEFLIIILIISSIWRISEFQKTRDYFIASSIVYDFHYEYWKKSNLKKVFYSM